MIEKEIPVDHDHYAVTLVATDKYGHFVTGTTWHSTSEKDKHKLYDKLMEICFEQFPKEHYTGHNAYSERIPHEYSLFDAQGNQIKYRYSIVGIVELSEDQKDKE